jgi:hypothetical protein
LDARQVADARAQPLRAFGAADSAFPDRGAAEPGEPAFEAMHAGGERLATRFDGEGDQDPAVPGVALAEHLDGRSEAGDGALLTPAGVVGAEPVAAAFSRDELVHVAIRAR